MTRALVIIVAIALSGCSTIATKWRESTPLEKVVVVGLVGVGVWAGAGVFVGSPRGRGCPSGQVVSCPPEIENGASCTCQ